MTGKGVASQATRENLGFLLAKASQRWNELLYGSFCRAGFRDIRPAHGSILLPLFEEDGLRMGELAGRSGLSKQAMTTLARVMERRKLIARRRDPSDARAFRVYLTPRARRFKTVVERILQDMEALVETRMTRTQKTKVARSLKKLMILRH